MKETTAHNIFDLQWPAQRDYAAPEDFCEIFDQEMDALYSLAFLLTADRQTAEKCFLDALDECRKSHGVFAEWASSWSRRAIIKQAIRQLRPKFATGSPVDAVQAPGEVEDIPRRLLRLRPFERVVFGMAVLERYSDRECAALLGCLVREVEAARIRALQFLGGSEGSGLIVPFAGGYPQESASVANVGGSV